jgi:hypothetical protein
MYVYNSEKNKQNSNTSKINRNYIYVHFMVYHEINIILVNDHHNFFSFLRLLWNANTANTLVYVRTLVLKNEDVCCRI